MRMQILSSKSTRFHAADEYDRKDPLGYQMTQRILRMYKKTLWCVFVYVSY